MLQPFEEFKPVFIKKLADMKKRYLVAQGYKRASEPFTEEPKTGILLTDYDNPGGANIHLNAIKHDPYAAIIDLENPNHKSKLQEMLLPGSKYKVFWAVVKSKKELKDRIDKRYKESMRRYIEKNTRWRIGSGETIYPDVDVTFGELFITLRYGGQRIRIKFEEIEKI